MLYSACAKTNAVIKTSDPRLLADPAFWIPVQITPDIALHFALLNQDTSPLGRIISALTRSSVHHVEIWLGGDAPEEIIQAAESSLGLPYDYTGALRAWDDCGYHTPGKEFCSGLAYELLTACPPPRLSPYPSPSKLLMEVSALLGQPMPILSAPPELVNEDFDYLADLHDTGTIAMGTVQEILAVLT